MNGMCAGRWVAVVVGCGGHYRSVIDTWPDGSVKTELVHVCGSMIEGLIGVTLVSSYGGSHAVKERGPTGSDARTSPCAGGN